MWGLKLLYSLSLYLFFLILQISKHSTDIADHNRHSKSISLFGNSGFQLEFESYPNVSCAHAVMQWIWFQVMYWFVFFGIELSFSLSLSRSFFLSRCFFFSWNNKIEWNEQLHCKGELFQNVLRCWTNRNCNYFSRHFKNSIEMNSTALTVRDARQVNWILWVHFF